MCVNLILMYAFRNSLAGYKTFGQTKLYILSKIVPEKFTYMTYHPVKYLLEMHRFLLPTFQDKLHGVCLKMEIFSTQVEMILQQVFNTHGK